MYQIFRGTYSTVPFNLGHTKQLVLVLEQRWVLNLNISFILFGRFTKTATTINLNLLEPKSQWKWGSSCLHISRYYYLVVIRITLRWKCCHDILMTMLSRHLGGNVATTSWWQETTTCWEATSVQCLLSLTLNWKFIYTNQFYIKPKIVQKL